MAKKLNLPSDWNGLDCDGSMHDAIWFYCCHVTTFDWYCQLSGIGSNNLNLQKLLFLLQP